MATQVELKLIGEKTLHHGANSLLLAYCPSMELLAVGSSDQQVSLYRLNGQRVYSVAQRGTSLTVDRISWKPNGKPLKCFDELLTDTSKASYLQWLGVMV
jgi:anaphase-promoting complex subunit 4